MTTEFDPESVVRDVTSALKKKFPDTDATELEALVRGEVDTLKDRPVRDYISVLAERAAREHLRRS